MNQGGRHLLTLLLTLTVALFGAAFTLTTAEDQPTEELVALLTITREQAREKSDTLQKPERSVLDPDNPAFFNASSPTGFFRFQMPLSGIGIQTDKIRDPPPA